MADKTLSPVTAADLDKRAVTMLAKQANTLKITNDDELHAAADLLARIKGQTKKLTKRKKEILDPLAASVKSIRQLFADPETTLSAAENTLKSAVIAYHDIKAEEARIQAERIERRVEKGTMKVETGMAKLGTIDQPDSALFTANGSTQVKQSAAKIRITDVGALPAEYLQRERVLEALRLEVAADVRNGIPCPAGAEVYRDKVVAAVVV